MSKKSHFLYSTLTADNIYPVYAPGGADLPVILKQVLVRGGTNVPDKRLITPMGVVTEVTSEELEALKTSAVFQAHVDNGYITISDHREDPEKVVATEGMETRDTSAPLVPEDFEPDAPGAKPTNLSPDANDASPPAPGSAPPAHPAAAQQANRRPRA